MGLQVTVAFFGDRYLEGGCWISEPDVYDALELSLYPGTANRWVNRRMDTFSSVVGKLGTGEYTLRKCLPDKLVAPMDERCRIAVSHCPFLPPQHHINCIVTGV